MNEEKECEYCDHDPREKYQFTLSAEEFKRFVEICENPPAPTQALIDLMRGETR